ncbi:CCR4-NOT transcription complex subunit 6-like [Perkinsus olseni]|uniref:CCR4-NOT transcription complex subunit 6-like n=1 Tax=Perkinsus olseni TaxID=32597 RepID=A0A7J6PWR0_PEROL|nr:CCR4-NOT transcription complex subunit 6-like [Perkinsus olseni]
MASEVPLPQATAEMKLRSPRRSESTVKMPHRNGYKKLNGDGQSLVQGVERLTAKSAAGRGRITDFIDQLHACGLREDTLGSLPTETLLRILQGLTARLANSKTRMDQRSNSLVTRIAEIVTDRAQDGDMPLDSLVYFLLRITQLGRLELLQVAANLPMQRFDEFFTTGDRGLSSLATALQVTQSWRVARNRGGQFPDFMYPLVRPDGRHCVALADSALAHLVAAGAPGGPSMHRNEESGFTPEEELVRVCVLLHRLRPQSEAVMGGMSFLARPEIINGFHGEQEGLHPALFAAAEFLSDEELLERMSPPVLYGVLLKHVAYLPEKSWQILLEIFLRRATNLPVTELQRCIVNFGPYEIFLERLSKYYGLYDVHADRQLVNRLCLESLGPVMKYLSKIAAGSEIWRSSEMPSLMLHAAHLAVVVKRDYQMQVELAACCARVGAKKVQSKSVYDILASALHHSGKVESSMGPLGEVCKAYGLPDRRANFGARGRASEAAAGFISDCVGRLSESNGEELAIFGELLRAAKWPMKQTWIALSGEVAKRSWRANRSGDRFRQNDTSPPAKEESQEPTTSGEHLGERRLSPVHAYRLYHSFANLHEGMAASLLPVVLISIRQEDRLEELAPLFRAWRVGDSEIGVMREAIGKCSARVDEAPRETLWEAVRVASLSGLPDAQIERLAEPLLMGSLGVPEGREIVIGSALVRRKGPEKVATILERLTENDRLCGILSKCDARELVDCHELCHWIGGRTMGEWNFVARRKIPEVQPDECLLSKLQEKVEEERAAVELLRNLGDRQCPSANGVTAGMGLAFFLLALGNSVDEYLLTG